MPFGSLNTEQRLRVLLELLGGPRYAAQMKAAAASTKGLAGATGMASASMKTLTERTFLHNQLMYTTRRFLFYNTLGFLALGASIFKLGFQFNNTMQQARVAFSGFLPSAHAVDVELRRLYALAALTPFQFPDLVIATRRLLPFTKNIGLTNRLVESVTNALSAMGITTAAALTRGTLALSHMFAIGRLTGQVLYQLGRDNIPMQQALQAEFHTTGEEIRRRVAGGLITATMAAQALNNYISKTPGYMDAATKQATRTLAGAWSTFKDILGMAAGSAEGGLFRGLQHMLQQIDFALFPLIKGGKPVTLTNLATAMDTVLTPKTHALINTFTLLENVLQGIIWQFHAISSTINFILSPLDMFGSGGHGAHLAMVLLGRALSVVIVLWTLGKIRLMALTFWTEIYVLRAFAARAATVALTLATKANLLWTGRSIAALRAWAFAQTFMYTGTMPAFGAAVYKNNTTLARFIRTMYSSLPAMARMALGLSGIGLALIGIGYAANKAAPYVDSFMDKLGLAGGGTIHNLKQFNKLPAHLRAALLKKDPNLVKQLASGTASFATGGVMPYTGLAMVGEQGRELAVMPQGTRIIPNNVTENLMTGALDGLVINVYPQDIYMDGMKVGRVISGAVGSVEARA